MASSRKLSRGLAEQDPARKREPLLHAGGRLQGPVAAGSQGRGPGARAAPGLQHRPPPRRRSRVGRRVRIGRSAAQGNRPAGTAAGSRNREKSPDPPEGRSTRGPSACGQRPAMLRSRVVLPLPVRPRDQQGAEARPQDLEPTRSLSSGRPSGGRAGGLGDQRVRSAAPRWSGRGQRASLVVDVEQPGELVQHRSVGARLGRLSRPRRKNDRAV